MYAPWSARVRGAVRVVQVVMGHVVLKEACMQSCMYACMYAVLGVVRKKPGQHQRANCNIG